MKAGIYLGKEQIEIRELPLPEVGDDDVLVQNIYSSVCGTDVAVFTHGPNTGHKVTVGCRAARQRMIPCGKEQYVAGQNAVVFGCGTIGIAAAVAFKHFGMEKVMICDRSDFRLGLAEQLGFAICNTVSEDFAARAIDYFGTAPSLNGAVANIDCWLDAAGAESILDDFLRLGKIESRFVSVAVNNKPRSIDLLHMTYAQQSIIGSGGYMPEDVRDVQKIMASEKWNLEQIITHEFSLDELEQAIRTAGDVDHAGNVVIKIKDEIGLPTGGDIHIL